MTRFDNRVTRMLGVDIPIVQAPMGWIARAQLASAVSNAGAMGIIETSSGELDVVKDEIRKMRDLTDRPFGVNIAQAFVRDPAIVDFVIAQGIQFVTTSAGSPVRYTAQLKAAGLTVFHVVPTLHGALKAVEAGVDGLVLAGAFVGVVLEPLRDETGERRANVWFAVAGAILIAVGWFGSLLPSPYANSYFWTSSPAFFALRIGILTLALPLVGFLADTTLAAAMEKILKQPVTVANKQGAAGAVGMASVAAAKPDGYTLLVALVSISVIPEADKLFGRPPAYTRDQFVGIARFGFYLGPHAGNRVGIVISCQRPPINCRIAVRLVAIVERGSSDVCNDIDQSPPRAERRNQCPIAGHSNRITVVVDLITEKVGRWGQLAQLISRTLQLFLHRGQQDILRARVAGVTA